jgi:hypothetical protein
MMGNEVERHVMAKLLRKPVFYAQVPVSMLLSIRDKGEPQLDFISLLVCPKSEFILEQVGEIFNEVGYGQL